MPANYSVQRNNLWRITPEVGLGYTPPNLEPVVYSAGGVTLLTQWSFYGNLATARVLEGGGSTTAHYTIPVTHAGWGVQDANMVRYEATGLDVLPAVSYNSTDIRMYQVTPGNLYQVSCSASLFPDDDSAHVLSDITSVSLTAYVVLSVYDAGEEGYLEKIKFPLEFNNTNINTLPASFNGIFISGGLISNVCSNFFVPPTPTDADYRVNFYIDLQVVSDTSLADATIYMTAFQFSILEYGSMDITITGA